MPIIADEFPNLLKKANHSHWPEECIIETQLRNFIRPGWSQLFHENVNRFNSSRKLDAKAEFHFKEYPWSQFIPLDQTVKNLAEDSLTKALFNRKTQRNFQMKSSCLEEISNIFLLGNGIKVKNSTSIANSKFEPCFKRINASAGKRYPLEAYLFAQNVENLNSGFYHYNINKRGLEFLRSCTNTKFFKSLFHQDDPSLDQANFAIFLTAIPHRTTEKYGTLGHNLIMIECGQLCQSFWLIASAMNLKVCPHSLINESLFFQTLNINSHQEILLYCLVFGK